MTHRQRPIHSGFDATTTTAEVLEGLDLTQVTALVTGGHSGLGWETTCALARAGAHVIVGARDPEAASKKLKGLSNVKTGRLNLAEPASVRDFAERLLTLRKHIDIVICNAGIMACPETRIGPGWEAQFATNHLGHYALVNLLWPVLQGGARIISVSSAGHHQSGIRWNDVHFAEGYDKWLAYGQSKTANSLFAIQLDRLGLNAGVRAFSLHPGKIFTPLQRYLTQEEMFASGWLDANGHPADPTFKSTQQGAATQVWAATSEQLNGLGGLYCEDCEIATLDETEPPSFTGVRPYAIDPEEAERLWALSARLTGLNAFSTK